MQRTTHPGLMHHISGSIGQQAEPPAVLSPVHIRHTPSIHNGLRPKAATLTFVLDSVVRSHISLHGCVSTPSGCRA
jgi:hypothetical protein